MEDFVKDLTSQEDIPDLPQELKDELGIVEEDIEDIVPDVIDEVEELVEEEELDADTTEVVE